MPISPKRICNHPGCNHTQHSSYCDDHKKEKKHGWTHKQTTTQRGYGAKWQKTRERILTRDMRLCQCDECKQSNRIRSANEVDHITSKQNAIALGWTDERIESDDNLQAINKECHKLKTAAERGRGH